MRTRMTVSRCSLLAGALSSLSHAAEQPKPFVLAKALRSSLVDERLSLRIPIAFNDESVQSSRKDSSPRAPSASSRNALQIRGGDVDVFLDAVDLCGTAVFAFSGALAAGKKGMDMLGMCIVATITSLGGGTIRDLLLDSGTVFWMREAIYLEICFLTTLLTYFLWPSLERRLGWKGSETFICVADALGLSAFSVLGTRKALAMGLRPAMGVVSGLISSCFGGLIRDLLFHQRSRIMYPDRSMYAFPPLVGSAIYAHFSNSNIERQRIAALSFLVTFTIRLLAFNSPARLPHWRNMESVHVVNQVAQSNGTSYYGRYGRY